MDMRFETGEFLSRILVKARKKYRFFGFWIGGYSVGIIWPTKREAPMYLATQSNLPGFGTTNVEEVNRAEGLY